MASKKGETAKKEVRPAVEKGIPVPESGTGHRYKYDFSVMELGDSQLYQGGLENDSRIRSALNMYKIRNPDFNYLTRSVEGGIRVWRIAPINGTKPRVNGRNK